MPPKILGIKINRPLLVGASAEFIASAVLLCNGCMDGTLHIMDSKMQDNLNQGLIVMIFTQIFGCVSGAHINPCVTIAAVIMGEMRGRHAYVYVFAQILGAICGFRFLLALTPAYLQNGMICVTEPAADTESSTAILIEYLLTGVWMCAVCSNWHYRNRAIRNEGALSIGMSVFCLSMIGTPFTNGSMNPARSLAPALWQGYYNELWVYFISPIAAAITIPYAWKKLLLDEEMIAAVDSSFDF